jgi:hypothetical protein
MLSVSILSTEEPARRSRGDDLETVYYLHESRSGLIVRLEAWEGKGVANWLKGESSQKASQVAERAFNALYREVLKERFLRSLEA